MSRFKTTLDTGTSPATWAGATTPPSWARRAAAWALRAASAALDRLARRLEVATPHAEALPADEREFYAQASAPEGALYVDGQFVGWLQGVQRL